MEYFQKTTAVSAPAEEIQPLSPTRYLQSLELCPGVGFVVTSTHSSAACFISADK